MLDNHWCRVVCTCDVWTNDCGDMIGHITYRYSNYVYFTSIYTKSTVILSVWVRYILTKITLAVNPSNKNNITYLHNFQIG